MDAEEEEANYFAVELLMPRRWLIEDVRAMGGVDLTKDTQVASLARKYCVSISMMAVRLMQLEKERDK